MRVKRGGNRRRRRKKILNLAKGYYLTKSNCYRIARDQVERSGNFAYRDRRQKKREFRKLWIMRIGAAARQHGLSYNSFIGGLRRSGVEVDRKMLADLAVREPEAFSKLAEQARAAQA